MKTSKLAELTYAKGRKSQRDPVWHHRNVCRLPQNSVTSADSVAAQKLSIYLWWNFTVQKIGRRIREHTHTQLTDSLFQQLPRASPLYKDPLRKFWRNTQHQNLITRSTNLGSKKFCNSEAKEEVSQIQCFPIPTSRQRTILHADNFQSQSKEFCSLTEVNTRNGPFARVIAVTLSLCTGSSSQQECLSLIKHRVHRLTVHLHKHLGPWKDFYGLFNFSELPVQLFLLFPNGKCVCSDGQTRYLPNQFCMRYKTKEKVAGDTDTNVNSSQSSQWWIIIRE